MRVVLIISEDTVFSGFIRIFFHIQKHLINMFDQPVQPIMSEVFG